MPLTNDQTKFFFENADNMAIEYDMLVKLQEEGIKDVNDLEMVDKDFLK